MNLRSSTCNEKGIGLLLLLWLLAVPRAQAAQPAGPVLLYSRYFNAEGETRYLPDGTFKQVLSRLREHFVVRVHNLPLTTEALAGVNVVLIANPSDKAVPGHPSPNHVSKRDLDALTRFVEAGGGLIVMGNQENHNLEVADMNKLLARFDFNSRISTRTRRSLLPGATPLIGGLRLLHRKPRRACARPSRQTACARRQ
jgi:hypothetical protein